MRAIFFVRGEDKSSTTTTTTTTAVCVFNEDQRAWGFVAACLMSQIWLCKCAFDNQEGGRWIG